MIKQAQIKFICIIMSILFAVFSVIGIITTSIMYNISEHSIEQTLDVTAESVYLTGPEEGLIHPKAIICRLIPTYEQQGSTYFLWFDDNCFTQQEADHIVNTVLSKHHNSGKINQVYFKIYHTQNDTLLVAIDAADIKLQNYYTISNLFIILTIIFLVLFAIVTALSFYVFKPIKDAFHKQKQFISNASHELKTPIAIISANADVISQDDDNKWVDNIKSQTVRMSGLVDDMLTLAKIDEGRIKLKSEKFNISDEIINCSLPFDALAFEKGKTLIINIEPDVIYTGDKASVNQIVNILLDNAVKHADKGGEIIVDFHKEKSKNLLSVSNTGSKIPAEQSNKVFERFYRGDSSRTRETGGSGLGLSIAKSVADANKWKISAQSIPDESMTITVVF